jgi:hypothetical protein
MCAQASTVLRAVAADFFFICWCLEIPSLNRIRHVPRCVHYHAQSFRLEPFPDFYFGSGSRTPELCSVSPNWFEYCFIYEKFVGCGKCLPSRCLTMEKNICFAQPLPNNDISDTQNDGTDL